MFFFKQKTAYEMRISDWSSDVCSSDLVGQRHFRDRDQSRRREQPAHTARDIGGGEGWFELRARGAGHRCPLIRFGGSEGNVVVEIVVEGRPSATARPAASRRAAAIDRKSTRLNSSH